MTFQQSFKKDTRYFRGYTINLLFSSWLMALGGGGTPGRLPFCSFGASGLAYHHITFSHYPQIFMLGILASCSTVGRRPLHFFASFSVRTEKGGVVAILCVFSMIFWLVIPRYNNHVCLGCYHKEAKFPSKSLIKILERRHYFCRQREYM